MFFSVWKTSEFSVIGHIFSGKELAMQNLESVREEMSAFEKVLMEYFRLLPTFKGGESRKEMETILIGLMLSTDGGMIADISGRKKGKTCQLHLRIVGFGRQFCEFHLSPCGGILQHDTARAVVNYVTNLLYANGYRMVRKPINDGGSVHDSTWAKYESPPPQSAKVNDTAKE